MKGEERKEKGDTDEINIHCPNDITNQQKIQPQKDYITDIIENIACQHGQNCKCVFNKFEAHHTTNNAATVP